ncbi:GTP-binding protein [Sarcoptes scabiei]|nr:GTP-binding protein [Sarcoptes scabiei]
MVRTIDQENDIITYSIEPGKFRDGSNFFEIDEKTGLITIRKSLQGQGGNTFSMYIKAFDGHQSAKIEVMISVLRGQDRGQIVYPDIMPHSKLWSTNILVNKTGKRIPVPKDLPLEVFHQHRVQSKTKPSFSEHHPSISKFNSLDSTPPSSQSEQSNHNYQSENFDSVTKKDQSDLIETENENSLLKIIIPFAPYVSLICFIPIVCFITWIIYYKCQRNVPTRNVIKTFSHKIINNNKLESIETTTSGSFKKASFTKGTLFRSIKKYQETNADCDISTPSSASSSNEWEFPRHHLRFMHILGQGCFGQVWKCEAFNLDHKNSTQIVAVKTLKENANEKEKKNLLEELEVMKILDRHPNVVTLIGCCTERDPVYLIMEFVPYGKLQKYLQDHREELNYGVEPYGTDSQKLTSHDLISFAYQIAKGMEFLSANNIIHRDLAARNILVGHDKVCKIADFGLAKYNQEIYERKSEGRLPIRWMATESLTDFMFTTKSDVWSFGILMWEIVTLGCTPYPGMTATEVIKKVCDGFRLEKPEHCRREMYNIMYYCWDRNPHHRPSFSELVCLLDNLFSSDDQYIELDRFPDHSYYNFLKQSNSGEKL